MSISGDISTKFLEYESRSNNVDEWFLLRMSLFKNSDGLMEDTNRMAGFSLLGTV